jgi:hypothetical protein
MEKHYDEQYDMDETWLAGFFDADGYLGVQPAKVQGQKIVFSLIPKAQINQKYVAGFIDGDGCVSCTVFPQKAHNSGYEIQPQVRMVEYHTKNVLPKIFRFLSSKGIKVALYLPNKTKKSGQGELVVYGIKNLSRFLNLVGPYLQSYKREQTQILLEKILPRLRRKEHVTKEGFIKLMAFVDLLNSLRNDHKERKYTKAYFEKIWSMRENQS